MAGLRATYDALMDTVSTAYDFGAVIDHEPLSAPTDPGVIACVFIADPIAPISESSGLAAADSRIGFMVRLLHNALSQPQGRDGRETALLDAFDHVMDALCRNLTLGGEARSIDVLGESGESLRGEWGYASIGGPGTGGGTMFRLVDITVPVMINNVWTYGN